MAEGLPLPVTAAVGRAVRITAAVERVMEVQAESFKKEVATAASLCYYLPHEDKC